MSMIKRAKRSGQIKQIATNPVEDFNLEWNDVVIKDVLDVPINSPASIDINLDEEEEGEIAIKC